jgi:hypothetical protein
LQSLEPQEFDRAGVKQRTYKNSVYKIRNRDREDAKPVYVVAEGATPLKTFHEVIKMDAKMSREYRIFYTIHVNRILDTVDQYCYLHVIFSIKG